MKAEVKDLERKGSGLVVVHEERARQKFGYNILVEAWETLPFPFHCYEKISFLMIEKKHSNKVGLSWTLL